MHVRTHRSAGLALAACTALALVAACGDDDSKAGTFFGPSEKMGDGTVKTYVTTDNDGNPSAVGIRLSDTAMNGLPEVDTVPPTMTMIDFPDQAASTPFDHAMINWNSHGHEPPPLFGKPHFDFHFDMTDMSTLNSIMPTDPAFAAKAEKLPAAKYVPADYATMQGPPLPLQAVPGMGIHLVDSKTPLIPGQYDFTQIFINGSWDGTYTFMEPMMTRQWLLTKPTLHQDIKQPQAYQKPGYYPTTYDVVYNNDEKSYDISLGGLTKREAS